MLFDRPAGFLYRHHRDLYMPMRLFATHYRQIVWVSFGLIALAMLAAMLSGGRLLSALNITG